MAIDLETSLAYEGGREPTRLVPDIESTAYRIVQEALTNAGKHANAGQVAVRIAEDTHQLLVTISDDGQGFNPRRVGSGLGLVGMRERVDLLGGALEIRSALDEGTVVEATLPVHRVGRGDLPIEPGAAG
jgi:signal transduction histidine kinase